MAKTNYNRYGINKNTYELLFREKEEYKKECSKEIFTVELSSYYDRQLYKRPYVLIKKMFDMYFYQVNYFNIYKKILKKGYKFKNKNIEFDFWYLERYLRKILKNEDTYVKKEMLFDLKHNLRYGSCLSKNMVISANLENSFFVTGLIPFEDGTKHLHSFVEYKDYVLDYTKNIIIKKEKYYSLLKVQELQRIKSEDIPTIYNTLVENCILNNLKYMATFGNEILNDLTKNPQLIKIKKEKADFSSLF